MKKIYAQLLTFICLLLMSTGAFAQPGAPDQTFGRNGRAMIIQPRSTVPIRVDNASPVAVETKIQPDKKILVLAKIDTLLEHFNANLDVGYQYYLYRLNPNGTYDSSFGINGSTPIVNDERPTSMELLPGGKFLVSSQIAVNINNLSQGIRFCLSRYHANGTIDNSFGTNGKTITPFDSCKFSIPQSIFVLANGNIIQAGCGSSAIANAKTYITLAGFNANGKIDSNYGINGRVALRATLDTTMATWGVASGIPAVIMLKQSNDKIVAAHNEKMQWGAPFNWQNKLFLIRFNLNGSVDNTFGNNGLVTQTIGIGVYGGAIQPDDKMVFSGGRLNAIRYNADGSRDSSFATNGISGTVQNLKVIVEPNNKLTILSNTTLLMNSISYMGRLNHNGKPDITFGKNGLRMFPQYLYNLPFLFGTGVYDIFTTLAIDSNNQYVLAGFRGCNNNNACFDSGVVTRLYNNSRGRYYNTITGSVFYDQNFNGVQNAGEATINNISVTSIKPGVDTVRNWNMNGTYDLEVDTGTYKTQVQPSNSYFNVVPASKTTTNSTWFNTDTVSFAMQPLSGKRDIAVNVSLYESIISTSGYASLMITYQNLGTDTVASGTLTFIKDSVYTGFFMNTAGANSISGDTATWNFTNLLPQEVRKINLILMLNPLGIGQKACVKSYINPIAGDLDTLNNSSKTCITELVGSYDPNFVTEGNGGKMALSKAKAGAYLTYTIHFQNTGDDTSYNVFIQDTMDSKLDWNSLQIVASSHKYQMTMYNKKCLFTFPFIKLVDSITNEPKSHGYIVYKIKAKPTVQLGDVFKNTAAIYFDYNLPIITNTEMTTIVADVLPLKLLSFTAKKENKTNLLNWKTTAEVNVSHFEIERSNNGRVFDKIGAVKAGNTSYSFIDEKPATRNTNYYRLKMIDKDGQFTYSQVRMINFSNSFNVAIYPNPAKDNLQVQIDSDKLTVLQMQVVSMDGKVLLSNSFSTKEGANLRSINISRLQKGSYLLKVKAASGEQVVKFEKL